MLNKIRFTLELKELNKIWFRRCRSSPTLAPQNVYRPTR